MTEKQFFIVIGILLVITLALGIISGDIWTLIHLIGYPIGGLMGWAVVTLIRR